jgi:hypothetical protein
VLIQVRRTSREVVEEALEDGWLACAPAQLADEYANRPGPD